MIRVLTFLMAAVMLAASPGVRADDGGPKAVIARAIKAQGGQEFLTQHPAARSRNTGKITLPGVGEAEFSQQVAYMVPDRFKDSLELTVAGNKIAVNTLVNGETVSIEVNGKMVPVDDRVKAAQKDARHMMKVARLVALATEKGYDLASAGEAKVGDKTTVGVRVSAKGEKDINLYFDKETGLLAKLEFRTTDSTTGNEITEERIVTEYQKGKDGQPVPKKVVVKHDGKMFLDADVLEMTYLEKIDESEFKK